MKILYITDLDGTLLRPDAALSDETRRMLKIFASEGVAVGVASSRSPLPASAILRGAEFSGPMLLMDGVVEMRGGRASHVELLRQDSARELAGAIERADEAAILYKMKPGDEVTENFYSRENPYLREFMDERIAKYGKLYKRVESFSDAGIEDVIFMTLRGDAEKFRALRDRMGELPGVAGVLYRDVYRKGAAYFELHSDAASKYHAAVRAKREGGFDRLVGFGDGANDLPLFRACDESYAVSNAAREVKEAADGVIGPNTEDSVVKKIAELSGLA